MSTVKGDLYRKKVPIPTSVSGVAYVSKRGVIRYAVTGKGVDLPSDFKEWVNKFR